MSDENTSSTQTSESTPASPSVSPASTFGDDMPNWVRTAGLEKAHTEAKPAEEPAAQAPAKVETPATAPSMPAATAQSAPAAPAFDNEALARSVAAAVSQVMPKQQQPGMSDNEIAKQLGIFTVTPDVYKSILGVDPEKPEQVVALNNAMQAVSRQSVTIAQVMFQQELSKLRGEFSPYMNLVKQQEGERIKAEFFKTHADLGGVEPIVRQIYEATLASGQKFPTLDAASKFVADKTREVLKSSGITPKAPMVPGAPTRTTAAPARTMSPTSMGGRSGGQPATGSSDKMKSVWGS